MADSAAGSSASLTSSTSPKASIAKDVKKQNYEYRADCYICYRKFGVIQNKRHHWRMCNRSVCNDDSKSRMILPGQTEPQRVWYFWHLNSVANQDAEKLELEKQLEELRSHISAKKVMNEEMEKTKIEQQAKIWTLEREKIQVETMHDQMKSNFQENLNEEQRKTVAAQRVSLSVKESYQEADQALQKCQNRMKMITDEEDYTKSDLESANQRKLTLKCEIEILTNQSKVGVPYAEVYKGLWKTCQKKIAKLKPPDENDEEPEMRKSQLHNYSVFSATSSWDPRRLNRSNADDPKSCQCVIM